MSEAEYLGLFIGLVFLILSAFFSSSEAAFLSMQRARLTHLVSTGVPGAARVAAMIKQPERLLSTILLGNNLANVAFTALVTVFIVSRLGEGRGVMTATAVSTAALLLLGETIPKTIAVRHPERVALLYQAPLKWIETLLLPIIIVLQWTSRCVSSLFGGRVAIRRPITESELRTLIDIGEEEGTFEPAEAEMLENVFRFGDSQVREVMTPRTEIVYIERGITLGQFLNIYAQNPHTRFPIYKGEVDNIIGIISLKDILKVMATSGINLDDSITDAIRDAYFVPETKLIADLFHELRQSGNQMAIAVDEYGGPGGLVTLKQLSEEVVGPVGEEGTGPEEEYKAIDEYTFQVDGGMSLDEVNTELDINLPDGDFETIAGFALDVLGHIPVVKESFEFENLKFEITEMKEMKIETIKVVKRRPLTRGEQTEDNSGKLPQDSNE